MTDAELIAHLRRTPGWPTLGKLAADRLSQLSEENEKLRKALRPFAEVTILSTGAVLGIRTACPYGLHSLVKNVLCPSP